MITQVSAYFRQAVRRLCIIAVGFVLFFGLMQPAVQAAPEVSSQNAEKVSSADLEQKKAERRAMQSQASRAADTEEEADSIGEVINDKLNLDEIVEENVIVDEARDALDVDDK